MSFLWERPPCRGVIDITKPGEEMDGGGKVDSDDSCCTFRSRPKVVVIVGSYACVVAALLQQQRTLAKKKKKKESERRVRLPPGTMISMTASPTPNPKRTTVYIFFIIFNVGHFRPFVFLVFFDLWLSRPIYGESSGIQGSHQSSLNQDYRKIGERKGDRLL